VPFGFAQTCVLVKQSANNLLVTPEVRALAHSTSGRASRKLTPSFFAEFLELLSPASLGILYQPTSVGLRYGLDKFYPPTIRRGKQRQFSRKKKSQNCLWVAPQAFGKTHRRSAGFS